MKRLKKKNNWNNETYTGRPGGLTFLDYYNKIYNDNIQNIQYNNSLINNWLFDENLDNQEWNLQK